MKTYTRGASGRVFAYFGLLEVGLASRRALHKPETWLKKLRGLKPETWLKKLTGPKPETWLKNRTGLKPETWLKNQTGFKPETWAKKESRPETLNLVEKPNRA